MKSEPTPSDREVLTGLVERVTYQNAENGFCVLRIKARGHRELVTLVGHAAAISEAMPSTAAPGGGWGRRPVAFGRSRPGARGHDCE
jgi:exodeoxyribonuclease V alpha subunit